MRSPNALLSELDFRPSRQLGQNFLKFPELAEKIINWAHLPDATAVIEVGPGLGALTEALLLRGLSVIAIEKDTRLHAYLTQTYNERSNLKLMLADALEIDYSQLCKDNPSHRHVFSNLPYSISTPLIERFLRARQYIETLTLLVQEEVALRMAAERGSKDYGRLAIWIQTLGEVRLGPRIPRKAFVPEPKVESRLVQVRLRSTPLIPDIDIEGFLEFVAKIFQFRRKMLRKALALSGLPPPEDIHPSVLAFMEKRAEALSIAELYHVYRHVAISHIDFANIKQE